MKHRSPTIAGFSLVFRRPAIALAEISWRWSFGAAVSALVFVSFFEYLDTLPVTNSDRFLLATGYPMFVLRALSHIFQGSAPRVVVAFVVMGIALSVGWIFLAAWGRAITLKSLLGSIKEDDAAPTFRLRSIVGLNFLRVCALVAAIVGLMGAFVLAGMATSTEDPSPGGAFLVFLLISFLTWTAWALINWFLSLAPLFVVARGEDAFGAMGTAADFCRNHLGALLAVSSWFGLGHLGVWFVANSMASFPMMLAGVMPKIVIFAGFAVVALIYFLAVDWLYMARLAAYAWIAEAPIVVEPPPVNTPPSVLSLLPGRVDPEELILSDIPVS